MKNASDSMKTITDKDAIMAVDIEPEKFRTTLPRKSRARRAAIVCGLMLALRAVAFSAEESPLRASGRENSGVFAGKVYAGVIKTSYGPRKVTYQLLKAAEYGLEKDLALFEGDIELTNIEKVKKGVALDQRSAGRTDTDFRWVDGVVPFEIDTAFTAAEQTMINNAINHWNAVTPYWFKIHTPGAGGDFIRFVRNSNVVCSSPVGRQGGRQNINLDLETVVTAGTCGTGGVIHEIGHAVGLWHEQSRADRNNFVTVFLANVQTVPVDARPNFETYIQQGEDGRDMFAYDFGSIMHYGSFAFSKNNLPTITRKDGTLINAQRNALSQGDIAGAVRLLTNDHGQPTFKIINWNSGKCLDVENASRSDGAAVNQITCHGLSNQRWHFWTVPGTNSTLIINDWSGQCLDIPGASQSDGAQLQQFSCHGFSNQQFRSSIFFSPLSFRFQNANSEKCLDVPFSGVRVQQSTCNSGFSQRWILTQ